MVKSLYTGVSGMKTHQQKMDVIGNNIANVNTTGYKTNVVTFADVYYQTKKSPSGASTTLGGVNPTQVGYGVKMNSTTPNMTQSGFTFSDSIYDMAIDGEGFFQVMDGAGNILYTRAGIFNVDEEGNLVNASGYRVLGVSGDFDGQPAGSQPIRITVPATDAKCSSATKTVNGCDVTIAVSDPSDNTDMSVTFNQAEFPFATYSSGVLNLYFDKDEPYQSAQDFENAIQKCLQAGGVTLPDDVTIKFSFENLPADVTSATAKANVDGWSKEISQASVDARVGIQVTTAGTTSTTYCSIGFATNDATTTAYNNATITLVDKSNGNPAETSVSYAETGGAGTWTINVTESTDAAEINQKIKDWIAANGSKFPGLNLTCTSYSIPSTVKVGNAVTELNKFKPLASDQGNGIHLVSAKASVGSVTANASTAGEYANDYKIVYKYVSSYDDPSASWDDNTLTISVTNKQYTTNADFVQDLNTAVTAAAGGNSKKLFTFDASSFSGIENLTNGQKKALFGGNPSLSFGGGKDSFYNTVAKSLSTFNLVDGRKGGEQSYKDLENVTVQQDGTIIGYHAVHGYMNLGRVDIATFDNPNGLVAMGGTLFAQSVASGEPKLAIAGKDGAGEVVAGALEMSNVDLAQEFTDMITTQRGYQANSRVITTSDTMLEELLSLKR